MSLGGIESVDAAVAAGRLVGLVLAEALVLYVGYGALERAVRPLAATLLRTDSGTPEPDR